MYNTCVKWPNNAVYLQFGGSECSVCCVVRDLMVFAGSSPCIPKAGRLDIGTDGALSFLCCHLFLFYKRCVCVTKLSLNRVALCECR